MKKHTHYYIFIIIMTIAVVLRFFNLDSADVLTDEASVSFRSIGYLDFLASPYQTTPLEWLDKWPWWLNLSFHDHPPLNFLIQHVFFRILGVSVFVMRLLPALAGVLSVALLYFIGKKISHFWVGAIASAILAVNNYHNWVSRLALQESITIFFILFSFWVFLVSLEKKKFFYLFGFVAGLTLLIKLSAFVLIPLIFAYVVLFRRDLFWLKEFYFANIIMFLLISPHILYNIMLYKGFGHFDYQWSYLIGQNVAAWQIRPGRFEFQGVGNKIFYFFKNYYNGFSPLFILISTGAIFLFLVRLLFKKVSVVKSYDGWYFVVTLQLLFFFFMVAGPSIRFLTFLTPYLALIIAIAVFEYWNTNTIIRKPLLFAGILFFSYEIFYAIQTNIPSSPDLGDRWQYSQLKQYTIPYGYNALEPYVQRLLSGKKSQVLLPVTNRNLDQFIKKEHQKQEGYEAPIMMIYDPRFYGESVLWFLTRRFVYQGWPVLSFEVYRETLKNLGDDFFKNMGIREYYYFAPTKNIILEPRQEAVDNVEKLNEFEKQLQGKSVRIDEIKNSFGKAVFRVYKFY